MVFKEDLTLTIIETWNQNSRQGFHYARILLRKSYKMK